MFAPLLHPLLLALGALGSPPGLDEVQVSLRYRSMRSFDLELPAEAFAPVGTSIPVPHAGGEGFACGLQGTELSIDSDGDGSLDLVVQPEVDDFGARRAMLSLRATGKGGQPLRYAIRLLDEGAGWQWAASGVLGAKVGDTRIQLVDLDHNGRHDDVGRDAMLIGNGREAGFLSRLVHVGGALHELEVSADGHSLILRPWQGETGLLDLRSQLETKAKLLSVLVCSEDGSLCFDLARAVDGLEVPVGTYRLHSGKLGLGASTVRVGAGRSEPLQVTAEHSAVVDWGGPVQAEFGYAQVGGQLHFDPEAVWYYGAAGERYLDWQPIGESPEFKILDADQGVPLAVAQFPGSC